MRVRSDVLALACGLCWALAAAAWADDTIIDPRLAAATSLSFAYDAQPPRESSAQAPSPEGGGSSSDADLANKLNNPVADLISVPFQFNYDTGFGPRNGDKYTLNIQPVIPFSISDDWNLITRTIMPVIAQEALSDTINGQDGLGDITQSFFFSPKQPIDGWIIGVGPAFLWPTATSHELGSGKWGVGPTAVFLRQDQGWTYGALVNHIWSYAGQSDRDEVNATFLQPFVAYTFPTATTLTLNTESTYDWTHKDWTVPINLVVSQVVRFGKLPVSFGLGGRYYADSPSGGPEWGLRFVVTLLFPR
jgi:hypothetical protein